jgi:hypothetical protein
MDYALTIQLDDGRIAAAIDAVTDVPAAVKIMAREAENLTRRHLRDRNRTHGTGRANYWRDAANSVFSTVNGRTAITVTIAKEGVRLRVLGGIVRPVNAKALTIPAHPAAYGRTADDPALPPLFVVVFKKRNRAALAARDGERLIVYYWLVKQTVHTPDPTAIPSETAYHAAIDARMTKWLDRQWQTHGKPSSAG